MLTFVKFCSSLSVHWFSAIQRTETVIPWFTGIQRTETVTHWFTGIQRN